MKNKKSDATIIKKVRLKFQMLKINFVAVILLLAISSGAFSFAFFAPEKSSTAEMVYCPLTLRLQPINPPREISIGDSLNEICANESQKDRFASAILRSAKVEVSKLNQLTFENLVFDFWQKGKSAFDNLPNLPNLPETFLAKNSFSTLTVGNQFENQFVWKTTEKFAFQLKPRPPTTRNSFVFEFQNVTKLDQISRQIAPRAPPFSI